MSLGKVLPALICVGLGPSAAPGRPETQPGESAFGPVIERVVLDAADRQQCFIDFDTGGLLTPHPRWPKLDDRLALGEYKRRTGADAFARLDGQTGLAISDVLAQRVDAAVWDAPAPPRDAFARLAFARPARTCLAPGRPATPPATYAFRTREGATGLVQVLGLTPRPAGLKIRYKLLRSARKPQEAPWGAAFNQLQCRLLPRTQTVEPSTGEVGRDVGAHLTYQLRNASDRSIKFLPWHTPLGGVSGNIFRVLDAGGRKVRYCGVYASRPPPEPADFITIHKGQTVSARVGLPYDLTRPGLYQVSTPGIATGNDLKQYYAGDAAKVAGNPDNVWTGTITSNTVTVRVVPEAAPWGQAARRGPARGVAARLRPQQAAQPAGTPATLKADLRNRGLRGLYFVPSHTPPEVELDGQWYRRRAKAAPAIASHPLGPGRQVRDIPIVLDDKWTRKEGGERLALAAGRHRVRVAFTPEPTDTGGGEPCRVVSNPIELEVLPAPGDPGAAVPTGRPETHPAAGAGARAAELIRRLGSGDYRRRMAAREALARMGEPAIPALRAALDDPDPEIARGAAAVLEEVQWRALALPASFRAAVRSLTSPDAATRAAAVSELGERGDQRTVELILPRLDDDSAEVRRQAGAALRQMTGEVFADDAERWRRWWRGVRQSGQSTEALIARLADPRMEVRRRAIWTLAWRRDPAALTALLERFVNRRGGEVRGKAVYADEEHYRQDRKHLRVALVLMGEPAIERLIPVAGFPWSIDDEAAEILTELGAPAVAPLIRALGGRDYRAKEGAAKVLGRLKPLEAVVPLVRACGGRQGSNVVAYRALAGYDGKALPALRQAWADAALNPHSRAAAAVMLAHLGDRSGWELLEKLVATGPRDRMNGAVGRMGKLRNRIFLPLIARALRRDDAEQIVAYAAAHCGGKEAIPILERARNHPSKGVRYGVKMWLERLAKEP